MKKDPFLKLNYYVIHHKYQTTSTKTCNLPIEQSIYSPECIPWESDVFRPNYSIEPSNQIELNESLFEDGKRFLSE